MRFSLVIHCRGEAFETPEACTTEVARLLREIAERIDPRETDIGRLVDGLGNTCGHFRFDTEENP